MKPKALILTGYGINAEKELKWAFDLAGAEGTIVHLEDLIENKKNTLPVIAECLKLLFNFNCFCYKL